MDLEGTFTITIKKEEDGYTGYVQENNISSFGETKEEALAMTSEALTLWIESQFKYRVNRLGSLIKAVKSRQDGDIYTVNFKNATNIYS